MESTDYTPTEPMKILDECREIMRKKSNDYQNPHSRIKQADYYPSGVATILDIIHAKVLRMRSVVEAMQHDPNYKPNFESFEDSCKDLINYAAFAASYSRGKIDGQAFGHDFLNRPRSITTVDASNMSDAQISKLLGINATVPNIS